MTVCLFGFKTFNKHLILGKLKKTRDYTKINDNRALNNPCPDLRTRCTNTLDKITTSISQRFSRLIADASIALSYRRPARCNNHDFPTNTGTTPSLLSSTISQQSFMESCEKLVLDQILEEKRQIDIEGVRSIVYLCLQEFIKVTGKLRTNLFDSQ